MKNKYCHLPMINLQIDNSRKVNTLLFVSIISLHILKTSLSPVLYRFLEYIAYNYYNIKEKMVTNRRWSQYQSISYNLV